MTPNWPRISFQQAAEMYRKGRRWEIESPLMEAFSGSVTSQDVARLASLFQIARQFPRWNPDRTNRKPADEYQAVVKRIKDYGQGLTSEDMVPTVNRLAAELSRLRVIHGEGAFRTVDDGSEGRPYTKGGCVPISAASKFLWFANPEVGIIYDTRAARSMRRLNRITWKSDYAAYVKSFLELLSERRSEIEEAVKAMGLPKPYSWAASKLLDSWLYQNGDPKI